MNFPSLRDFEVLRVLLDEGPIVCVVLVDGINQHPFLPLFSALSGKLIIVEKVGGQHCFRFDPAVFARNDLGGCIVLRVVASDATIN